MRTIIAEPFLLKTSLSEISERSSWNYFWNFLLKLNALHFFSAIFVEKRDSFFVVHATLCHLFVSVHSPIHSLVLLIATPMYRKKLLNIVKCVSCSNSYFSEERASSFRMQLQRPIVTRKYIPSSFSKIKYIPFRFRAQIKPCTA